MRPARMGRDASPRIGSSWPAQEGRLAPLSSRFAQAIPAAGLLSPRFIDNRRKLQRSEFTLVAPLSRNLPPFASRPALVVVALALGGFLVDLFVRPVSTEGFLLILLAASPFLLELLRPARQPAEIVEEAEADSPPAPARPAAKAPAPAAPRPVERPRTEIPRPAATRPAPAAPRETAAPGSPRPAVRPSQPEPTRPAAVRSREADPARPARPEPEKLL